MRNGKCVASVFIDVDAAPRIGSGEIRFGPSDPRGYPNGGMIISVTVGDRISPRGNWRCLALLRTRCFPGA
jgi:hypothetical protein